VVEDLRLNISAATQSQAASGTLASSASSQRSARQACKKNILHLHAPYNTCSILTTNSKTCLISVDVAAQGQQMQAVLNAVAKNLLVTAHWLLDLRRLSNLTPDKDSGQLHASTSTACICHNCVYHTIRGGVCCSSKLS
jgi:hypothetical protein